MTKGTKIVLALLSLAAAFNMVLAILYTIDGNPRDGSYSFHGAIVYCILIILTLRGGLDYD